VKYLILLVVVVFVLWLMLGRRPRPAPPKPAAPRQPLAVEGMLVCAHCGVHLPRSEALLGTGLPYCSAAHRDAGPRGP
jgi:uncharacterized protein